MTKVTKWHGCYDGNLKDLIVPEAFKHPAKMSRKLCERIFDYGREKGYWQPGDTIIDPFGGIGTTGIIGAYRGYHVVCIELEEEFVNLSKQNFELNHQKIEVLGNPIPVIIQGDSRKLLEILGQANGCVTSPPFLQSSGGQPEPKEGGSIDEALYSRHLAGNKSAKAYGNKEGQIHNLPEGDHDQVVGAISSPPYSSSITKIRSSHLEKDRLASKGKSDQPYGLMQDGSVPIERYGQSEGQLGSMPEGDLLSVTGAITSPPWEDNVADGGWQLLGKYAEEGRLTVDQVQGDPQKSYPSWSKDRDTSYGETEGQLGKMPRGDRNQVAGSITSPPYEDSVNSFHSGIDWEKCDRPERNNPSNSRQAVQAGGLAFNYGQTDGQLGSEKGDTYWSAVALIYQQVFQLLPPGGAFAVVIKDFVRNKKRVPLCDQTAELLKTIGFDIPERIHAMLIKEIAQTEDMFTGKSDPIRKERKSFFRRLAEKKGAPPIDWEEVIWAIKPNIG